MTSRQLWHEPRIHVQAAPDSVSSRILKLGLSPEGAFIPYVFSATFLLSLRVYKITIFSSELCSYLTWAQDRSAGQFSSSSNRFKTLTKTDQNLTKSSPILGQTWPNLTKTWPKPWPKTWPKLDQNLTKTWPKLSALGFAQHSLDSRTARQVNFLLLLWNRFLTSWPKLGEKRGLRPVEMALSVDHTPSYFLLTSWSFLHAQFFSFSVVVPWAKMSDPVSSIIPKCKGFNSPDSIGKAGGFDFY